MKISHVVFFGTIIVSAYVDAITIDTVTVGNPGNAPDKRYAEPSVPQGFGGVNHVYQMGKYEVTAGQYTAFLNAVAKEDTYELYNMNMADPVNALGADIQRIGVSPNFSYSVAADWADRPVNYVSFFDAARFANWLNNGQPTGAEGPTTTEDGAYKISVTHDFLGNIRQGITLRKGGARFFIPTEDEWYKAAYHEKSAGLAASYFDYPTGSNTKPGNDVTETTNPGNNANYYINDEAIGSPYHRTVVGQFASSSSPYGTFDQGGNVWEWTETTRFDEYFTRGGSFFKSTEDFLSASYRSAYQNGEHETSLLGFRIASVPEPGVLLLTLTSGILALALERRMRLHHGG